MPSNFKFGERSEKELQGVHPDVVRVARRALELTEVDFAVTDGLRTREEQVELVRTGASKTMNSKHLPQADGRGHAVDLTPYLNGKPRWEWPLVFKVARAVRQAARELGVEMVWGATWDRVLNRLPEDLEAEVEAYKKRHPGPDFLDGPHYQKA
jgi:peptidoglycan LD-endopeptidase CwlK